MKNLNNEKILFICLGNVARSQMAESFFNKFTGTKNGSSAGTLDFTPAKYGHPIKNVIAVMSEKGIDVSTQKVKQVTLEMVARADKIIVMCKLEECPDFIRKEDKTIFWTIEDPFGTSLPNFRFIRNQIEEKVKNLVKVLNQSVTITRGETI